ncbi:MAG: polysaccharide ABC transporter ATP-binding protein [Chloroflexota bacterium]
MNMSNEIAIRVEGLGKKYQIGRLRQQQEGLAGALREAVVAPVRRIGKLLRGQAYGAAELDETLWALRDINFEVPRGQVLGVIGANGAGKSTLLKVLTGITEPSEGRALIHGRVAALLEVGTGFHPELTGRENVYLNGTILGMTRAEIDRKFDEIVEFAGVSKFIDTPIKHYSSGMKVRLGFSVAAHLEPEILLIDEVLSVGDAAFQRKSLGKIDDITKSGRTVLFVSHNMASVEGLCHRTLLLQEGSLVGDGAPSQIIKQYSLSLSGEKQSSVDLSQHPNRRKESSPVMQCIRITDLTGKETSTLLMGQDCYIALEVDTGDDVLMSPDAVIAIANTRGTYMCRFDMQAMGTSVPERLSGRHVIRLRWQNPRFVPDTYTMHLTVKSGGRPVDGIVYAMTFEVLEADIYGTGKYINDGVLFVPEGSWTFEQVT